MRDYASFLARWKSQRPYTIAFLIFIVAFAIPFCTRKTSMWDQVYVTAAHRMQANEDIFQDGFVYPPAFAWLAIPFASLPPLLARLAWYAVNVIAMVVLLRLSWRMSGGKRLEGEPPTQRTEHFILLLGLGCAVYYILDGLTNQQTDLVIVALVTLGCHWLIQRRDLLAGIPLGVAAGLKCTPLLFAPYLIWRGRFRSAGVLFGVALLINLVPDGTHPSPHGRGRLHHWASTHLAPMQNDDFQPGSWHSDITYNYSFAGVANRWWTAERNWDGRGYQAVLRTDAPSASFMKKIVLGGLCAFLLLTLVVAGRRETLPNEIEPSQTVLECGLVMILMVLMSPMSSKPHFATLMLPGLCLARVVVQTRRLLPMLCLAGTIGFGLVSNKDLVGGTVYNFAIWYGSVFWSTVLLFAGSCWALCYTKGNAVPPQEVGDLPPPQTEPLRLAA